MKVAVSKVRMDEGNPDLAFPIKNMFKDEKKEYVEKKAKVLSVVSLP